MSILENTITWLAPPACISCEKEGLSICRDCADRLITAFGERCWRCNKLSPGSKTCDNCRHTGSPGRVWIVTNYEGIASDLLRLYKFGQQRMAARSIAGLMADVISAADSEFTSQKDYTVMPIPTATSRVRERGFDHTAVLAKILAANLRLRQSNGLRRLGQTRQLGSKRTERLAQLSNSLVVKSQNDIQGRNILLVDDVVTTGGTLVAAAKTLRGAGAKSVDALLFAKRL